MKFLLHVALFPPWYIDFECQIFALFSTLNQAYFLCMFAKTYERKNNPKENSLNNRKNKNVRYFGVLQIKKNPILQKPCVNDQTTHKKIMNFSEIETKEKLGKVPKK